MKILWVGALLLSASTARAAGADSVAGVAQSSAPEFSQSLGIRLSLGSRLIPAADLDRQFTVGGTGPSNGDFWTADSNLALGYQSASFFGLELGLEGNGVLTSLTGANTAPGQNDIAFSARSGNSTYDEYFTLTSYYLMPTLRLPVNGLFEHPAYHTLGLKVEATTLAGYSYSYYYYNYNDSSFKDQTTTYAVEYRLEQMLGRRFSLGFDLGYHWASFNPASSNGSRITRLDGSPLTLDLSGPRVGLSVSFWPIRPFVNAAEDLARIRERQQARQARRRARYGDVNTNSDTAQRLVEKGDALMQEKSYDLAAAMYQQAVSSDVNSRWAWQGLGNANYYQGLKDEALKAYYRAFALSEGDEKLKAMIERLKREGAKGKP